MALFTGVRTWARDGIRAPHKPLLLLLALARIQAEADPEAGRLSFEDTEATLRELLHAFGPPRTSVRPEYPFWRLQNDGSGAVWTISTTGSTPVPNSAGDVSAAALRDAHSVGSIPTSLAVVLSRRPALVNRIVTELLDANWESSLHQDILDAVSFPWVVEHDRARVRDPEFRRVILRIYERRCAFCGYDGRLGDGPLAVEAAHVRWHAAAGPDTPDNGLALCTLHHRAFDAGALGLDAERRILVSQDLTGGDVVARTLLALRGAPVREPIAEAAPSEAHMRWHREQVFRAPAR